MEEAIRLFKEYVALKGKKEIQKEWLNCEGPWYSIRIRNTLGNKAFKK